MNTNKEQLVVSILRKCFTTLAVLSAGASPLRKDVFINIAGGIKSRKYPSDPQLVRLTDKAKIKNRLPQSLFAGEG
jgi:hypothetical protein